MLHICHNHAVSVKFRASCDVVTRYLTNANTKKSSLKPSGFYVMMHIFLKFALAQVLMTYEGEYRSLNLENTIEQTDKLKKIEKKISIAGQGHFHCFFLNFHTWQLLPFSLFVSQ